MAKKIKNQSLGRARDAKQDEFYTQLPDIERELKHYKKHFKGKVVYCNCDDPRISNFFHYFSYNFEKLGLRKLITTCYKNQSRDLFSRNDSEQAIYLEYSGGINGTGVPDPEKSASSTLRVTVISVAWKVQDRLSGLISSLQTRRFHCSVSTLPSSLSTTKDS